MATILYIDNDPHYAWMICALLTPRGFTVETASDCVEGMRRARELQPDLILMDLFLGGLGSTRVISMLKKEALTQHIPIVVLSDLPIGRSYRMLLGSGVEDLLYKPFTIEGLVETICRHLPRFVEQLPHPRVH